MTIGKADTLHFDGSMANGVQYLNEAASGYGGRRAVDDWQACGPQQTWSSALRVDGISRSRLEEAVFAEWGSQSFLIPAYLRECARGYTVVVSRLVRTSGGYTPGQETLSAMLTGLQARLEREGFTVEPAASDLPWQNRLRAIFGLQERTFGDYHELSEVAAALPRGLKLTSVQICAAGEGRLYSEPAVEIIGPESPQLVERILQAASDFDQEKISIELFREGKSWTYSSKCGCLPALPV
jgi:hypothetical protein